MDVKSYKPGQRITSMSRVRFVALYQEMHDGSALERWPEGKVAETKKERVEERQMLTIAMLIQSHPNVVKDLLVDERWRMLEVFMREDRFLHFRAIGWKEYHVPWT